MADANYAQAAKAYDKAFRLEKTANILKRLHKAMRLNKQTASADHLLADWLDAHPDDVQIRLYYADAAIKQGDYSLAIGQYRSILEKQPENLEVMHNLVWCYQQQHDEAKALEVAEQAYKVKPDARVGLVDLAGLLLDQAQKSDRKRAVILLEKARDVAPSVLETHYFLAKAYVETGDNDRARKELEHLLLSNEDFSGRTDAERLLDKLSK